MAAEAPTGIGPHVRPHQPAHEGHGQDGGDHGECRQDGGIAHLVHCFDRHFGRATAAVFRQAEMPHDVLHHHDGVVHQDADGEDQRKQRDPVECVAVEIEDGQVRASVTGTASSTTPDSRQPSARAISM